MPFDQPQRDAPTYLFLRLHGQGLVFAQIFWGLGLFPFGMLVIRSNFIPRALGVILMIAGSGYLASSFASLFLPQHVRMASQIATVLAFGEVPLVFWLLIWGAKVKPSDAPAFTSKAQAGAAG